MNNVSVKITIEAPAEKIWENLSSFSGVERYVPMVKSSTVQGCGEGAQRTCSIQMGDQEGKLLEKLTKLDEENKTLQISMLEAPTPFQGVAINMQVKSIADGKSEFHVWSELSEEQGQMMQGVFQMIADGLKKFHEEKK